METATPEQPNTYKASLSFYIRACLRRSFGMEKRQVELTSRHSPRHLVVPPQPDPIPGHPFGDFGQSRPNLVGSQLALGVDAVELAGKVGEPGVYVGEWAWSS